MTLPNEKGETVETVSVLRVACPWCGAPPGHECSIPSGAARRPAHVDRCREAAYTAALLREKSA